MDDAQQQEKLTLIDTFPAFLDYWHEVEGAPLERQIACWAEDYMAPWPELLAKQQDDYAEEPGGWQKVARQRVFPSLPRLLEAMKQAHDSLLPLCLPVYRQVDTVLGFGAPVTMVIYVGIGCGAGWASRYAGQPAVLFGLENIADEGWTERDRLEGLVAHELGHLLHFERRDERGIGRGEGAYWQLYTEGFAERCEHQVLGRESWHMRREGGEKGEGWLPWCRRNLPWLAAEFLRRVEAGEGVRDFFGSWFHIRGYKQTGYFLGHELLKRWEEEQSLAEIALIEDVDAHVRHSLQQMAAAR